MSVNEKLSVSGTPTDLVHAICRALVTVKKKKDSFSFSRTELWHVDRQQRKRRRQQRGKYMWTRVEEEGVGQYDEETRRGGDRETKE